MAKFEVVVSVMNGALRGNSHTEVIEIDDEDLEGYADEPQERTEFIEEYLKEEVDKLIEWGWTEQS